MLCSYNLELNDFHTLINTIHVLIITFWSTDPLDLTVVDETAIEQAPRSADGLPIELDVKFSMLEIPVSIKLKRNPKVTSAKDIYVIRKSESGIPVVVPQTLSKKEVSSLKNQYWSINRLGL